MTFAQLVTFALGHRQQEIDFLIPEGSHGFQDVLKPNGTKYFLVTKFNIKYKEPLIKFSQAAEEKIQFECKPTW